MSWIDATLRCDAERAIPRASKVLTYMMLKMLPPSMTTLERQFEQTIASRVGSRMGDPVWVIAPIVRD